MGLIVKAFAVLHDPEQTAPLRDRAPLPTGACNFVVQSWSRSELLGKTHPNPLKLLTRHVPSLWLYEAFCEAFSSALAMPPRVLLEVHHQMGPLSIGGTPAFCQPVVNRVV